MLWVLVRRDDNVGGGDSTVTPDYSVPLGEVRVSTDPHASVAFGGCCPWAAVNDPRVNLAARSVRIRTAHNNKARSQLLYCVTNRIVVWKRKWRR